MMAAYRKKGKVGAKIDVLLDQKYMSKIALW